PRGRPPAAAGVAGGAADGPAGDGGRGADPAHPGRRARGRRPGLVPAHQGRRTRRAPERARRRRGRPDRGDAAQLPGRREGLAVTETRMTDAAANDAAALLEPGRRWRNWGRVESADPVWVARPTSVEEVAAVVRRARELGLAVKAIGAGHSFTGIAAAPGVQLDLGGLDGLLAVDAARHRVTLGAGTNLY